MRQNNQQIHSRYANASLYTRATLLALLMLASLLYKFDLVEGSALRPSESLEQGVYVSLLLVGGVIAVSFLYEGARAVLSSKTLAEEDNAQAAVFKSKTVARQISVEEFEAQKNEFTRKEIEGLVGSTAYQSAVKAKGAKPENWNWQKYERSNGQFNAPLSEDELMQDNTHTHTEENSLAEEEIEHSLAATWAQ